MSRSPFVPVVLFAAALTSACGSSASTSTAPTPVSLTEAFTGTLTVNGAITHPFGVQQTGPVTASLTSLSTDGATIGLSLGTWNGAVCQIILANDNAIVGNTVTGSAASTGNFCARVYDVGKLSGATDYVITITHY